jgi:hypothetical protein
MTASSSSTNLATQHIPKGFEKHTFERTFRIPRPRQEVWNLLTNPKTFTTGQLFPYRVEFVDDSGSKGAGFKYGTQTLHHGPLINFAGVIGEVRDQEYRDLQYYYGSYIFSLRLLRPTRLEFYFSAPSSSTTLVTLRVSSLIRRPFGPIWSAIQVLFWSQFGWNIRIWMAALKLFKR